MYIYTCLQWFPDILVPLQVGLPTAVHELLNVICIVCSQILSVENGTCNGFKTLEKYLRHNWKEHNYSQICENFN